MPRKSQGAAPRCTEGKQPTRKTRFIGANGAGRLLHHGVSLTGARQKQEWSPAPGGLDHYPLPRNDRHMSDHTTVTGLLELEGNQLYLTDRQNKRWRIKGDPRLIGLSGNYVHLAGHAKEGEILDVFHFEEVDRYS